MPSTQLTNNSGVISPTNPLDVKPGGLPTTPRSGQVSVVTAGTRVRLSPTTIPLVAGQVIIKALAGNGANIIFVGGSDVSSANGHRLAANEETVVLVSDVMNVWIDADANAKGVSWIAS